MKTTTSDSDKLQKPRVSRHGKQMHLNYECPHRLNVTKVYPVQTPRGADIIISGYDHGLHILWRGGRPLSTASRTVRERVDDLAGTRTHRTEWNHPIDVTTSAVTEDIPDQDKPRYDAEDEELDEDEPYPSFTQELKLSFGSPVLRLALPNVPQASSSLQSKARVPLIIRQRIVLAVACADATLRLITLPLTPPSASAKRNGRLGAQICELSPSAASSAMARDIALTWTSSSSLSDANNQMDLDNPQQQQPTANDEKLDLLVASSTSVHLETLTFYRIPIAFDELTGGKIPTAVIPFHAVPLSSSSQCLRFSTAQYPSRHHSRLLVADVKGALKIYDPLAPKGRPSSRASADDSSAETGSWISAFNTSFQMPKGATSNYPGLAQRRKIVDVAWVSGAKAALVLLDRGEWGVWDIDGVTQKKMNTFVIQGFIGSPDAAPTSELKSRSAQGLAPSTPNTRQQRQESLFGAPKPAAPATTTARGGVCAVATAGNHGHVDDSVVLWYGSDAYHIPSLAALWQRSLNSSGKDIGSLYGPGLSHIEGLDLSGEILNGVTQFPVRSTAINLGSMSLRDFVVTGEYSLIIIQSMRPQKPSRSLFAQATGGSSNGPSVFDQHLLERGELDLGGMDRLLDGMGSRNGFAPAATKKRVGFAG
ncbi:hypothetical protein M436DRAFT_56179 [Aureobasidium namibiae CBS 147.97]|uniref:Nucleoporin NUP37 n=1 Tax=Aureobasidium namibiae CBS 147.97 TaxID=1043004 RepID=A0A074WHT6_9PEZI